MFRILLSVVIGFFLLSGFSSVNAVETHDLYPKFRYPAQPLLFRTVLGPFVKKVSKPISREGLDHLKLSGSAQFSTQDELDWVKAQIAQVHDQSIVILDLRRECHGYVNGIAVNWKLKELIDEQEYEYNIGLGVEEIEEMEVEILAGIFKNGPGTFKTYGEPLFIDPQTVQGEQILVRDAGMQYVRLPTLDHAVPTDAEVDAFVEFYNALPEDVWLHVHCAGGKGRTTVFMSLVDMMHNCQNLSAEEILLRQQALGGSNLLEPQLSYPAGSLKLERAYQRLAFMHQFHAYCLKNPDFKVSWSAWRCA